MHRTCRQTSPLRPSRNKSAAARRRPIRRHGRHRGGDPLSKPEHDAEPDSLNGKYAPWVSLLREDSGYLRSALAPAYWALAPYYVGQFTETACSLASAVMVVNAGRANIARSAGTKLITQTSLLETVASELWRAGV